MWRPVRPGRRLRDHAGSTRTLEGKDCSRTLCGHRFPRRQAVTRVARIQVDVLGPTRPITRAEREAYGFGEPLHVDWEAKKDRVPKGGRAAVVSCLGIGTGIHRRIRGFAMKICKRFRSGNCVRSGQSASHADPHSGVAVQALQRARDVNKPMINAEESRRAGIEGRFRRHSSVRVVRSRSLAGKTHYNTS